MTFKTYLHEMPPYVYRFGMICAPAVIVGQMVRAMEAERLEAKAKAEEWVPPVKERREIKDTSFNVIFAHPPALDWQALRDSVSGGIKWLTVDSVSANPPGVMSGREPTAADHAAMIEAIEAHQAAELQELEGMSLQDDAVTEGGNIIAFKTAPKARTFGDLAGSALQMAANALTGLGASADEVTEALHQMQHRGKAAREALERAGRYGVILSQIEHRKREAVAFRLFGHLKLFKPVSWEQALT